MWGKHGVQKESKKGQHLVTRGQNAGKGHNHERGQEANWFFFLILHMCMQVHAHTHPVSL